GGRGRRGPAGPALGRGPPARPRPGTPRGPAHTAPALSPCRAASRALRRAGSLRCRRDLGPAPSAGAGRRALRRVGSPRLRRAAPRRPAPRLAGSPRCRGAPGPPALRPTRDHATPLLRAGPRVSAPPLLLAGPAAGASPRQVTDLVPQGRVDRPDAAAEVPQRHVPQLVRLQEAGPPAGVADGTRGQRDHPGAPA